MTVPSTARRAGPFTGSGALVSYPFTFKAFEKADLEVTVADTNSIESVLVLDSSVLVTLNVDQDATPGGAVQYASGGVAAALPLGYTLVITSEGLEYEQTADLPTGGNFSAVVVENALDRQMMLTQNLRDSISRVLQLSVTSPAGVDPTLPQPEAGSVIGWNPTADALQNFDPASFAGAVVFGTANADTFTGTGAQTAFTLSSNPGAQNNIRVAIGGVVQTPGTDYTWSAGTTLTFASAPANGVPILVQYMRVLPQGTIDAGSVLVDESADYADGSAGFLLVKNAGRPYNAYRALTKLQRADVRAYAYGVDTTSILSALLADAGIYEIDLPPGGWLTTGNLSIPNFKTLAGAGYGLSAGQAPTRILKRGNFDGITINAGSQLRNLSIEGDTGNGGDGVYLLSGRSRIENVSSFLHGQDGFKIGPKAVGGNANLWDLRGLISRSNVRHGMLLEHTGAALLPDAGAGILNGYEASFNGGDGLQVGSTIDNQLYGVVCQTNGGWGVRYKQYARGNFMPLAYTENNTLGDTTYESGADRNFLFGFRNGLVNDGIVNNGAENMIVGRQGSIEGIPLHRAAEAFLEMRIFELTTSGQWKFKKEATTRNLLLELGNTSSSGDVLITNTGGGAAGLRFVAGTASNDSALRGLKARINTTINFGLIAANSSADQTVTVTGADNTWSFLASPTHAIPAGVSWCAYWDSGASAVKVRCLNGTGAGVTVNGTFILTAFKNA